MILTKYYECIITLVDFKLIMKRKYFYFRFSGTKENSTHENEQRYNF